MAREKREKVRSRRAVRMGWKLFAYLMVFVLFILGVIWFFQIHMLDYFYKNTKYKELETISEIVAEYVDTESLEEAVDSCAAEYSMCIRVFRQSEQVANEVANADVVVDCLIHDLSQTELNDFYRKTKEGGGVYAATREMHSRRDTFFDRWNPDALFVDRVSVGMVYNTIIPGAEGAEYMIMLGAELTPVDATVNTLKTQFIWIVTILLFCGALMVVLLYRHISAPLMRMNEAAQQLAKGRYDTVFSGEGYLDGCISFAREAAKKGCFIALRLWNLGSDADNSLILDRLKKEFPDEWVPIRGGISERLDTGIFLEWGERFDWPDAFDTELESSDEVFCYALRNQIGVLVDGTVVPCCLDADGSLALGNLFSNELEEILSTKRAKAMFDGFSCRKASEEMCKRCGFAKKFSKNI